MQAERIFSAEQLKVPPQLPNILRDFSKEVIRYQPDNIAQFGISIIDQSGPLLLKWGREYFTALENKELTEFLKKKEAEVLKEENVAENENLELELSPSETLAVSHDRN